MNTYKCIYSISCIEHTANKMINKYSNIWYIYYEILCIVDDLVTSNIEGVSVL